MMEVYRVTDRSAEEAAASASYVGAVAVQVLSTSINDGIEVRLMRFGPGGRSRPNVCTTGRVVHVVAGEAVVAGERNRVVVGPGDSVEVPAGEWHWHGGLPHVPALILVVERPANVSWNVPAGTWADGYDPAAPPPE
jgi:quercetin dioxygenase-like cupin family protein